MDEGRKLDAHISLALDIGMRMLVCGAQISRVEDSIGRICKALGAVDTHVFSVTSGIIVTAFDANGNSATQLRRIHSGSYDLARLQMLNQLSRDICSKHLTDQEITARLRAIDMQKKPRLWVLALAYALISGVFSIFFGANWTDGICAACTGVILCLLEYWIKKAGFDHVFAVFGVSFLVGLCNALLVMVGLGHNYDAISIGNIMLLIPGIAMTNAVHDMFVDDMLSGISRFFRSLVIAFIVTFGFTVAGMILKTSGTPQMQLAFPWLQAMLQIITGALGSLGFALTFHVRGKMLVFAFLGGFLSWGMCCLSGFIGISHEALQYLVATTVLTLYAELMARYLHCPSTILLVTGWIPLIPGGSLYRSINALVTGNFMDFVNRTLNTFLLMVAMSTGMLLAMTIIHLFSPLHHKSYKHKQTVK